MEDINNNIITPDQSVAQQSETPSIQPNQKPKSNIYKYLFFIILIVFLYLFGGIIFSVITNKKNSQLSNNNVIKPTPTIVSRETIESVPQPTTPASCSPTNIIDKSVYKDSKITNWIDYENSEFGFAFSYPKEFGKVKVTSSLGFGCVGGRIIRFMFYQKEEDCIKGYGWTCGNVIEIEAAAPDFSGHGNDRASAYSAGYTKNKDGSVSYKLLTEKSLEDIPEYKNPIFFKGINTEGIIRLSWSEMSNKNFVKIIFNLKNDEITGIGFMTNDVIGETKNADVLKSITKTFRLLN